MRFGGDLVGDAPGSDVTPRGGGSLLHEAAALGIAEITLRRARKALGGQVRREGFGKDGRLLLALPTNGLDTADGATPRNGNGSLHEGVGLSCRADSLFPIIVSQPTDESGLHLGTYFATAAGSANGNPPTELVEAAPLTACGVEEIVVVEAASTCFPVVGSSISTVGGSFRRST